MTTGLKMNTGGKIRSCSNLRPTPRGIRHIVYDENRPWLLDLFAGCGGASMGYYRAGFNVLGVDIAPQPFYPFDFVQFDALQLDYDFLLQFDAIHASPPCQHYSTATRGRQHLYPDLIPPVRQLLAAAGKPFIIENVVGSPLKGIRLYGDMFGLRVLRARIFESNIPLDANLTRDKKLGKYEKVYGKHCSTKSWRDLLTMGITWADIDGIREAIPPAYTQHIGIQLFDWLHMRHVGKLSGSAASNLSSGANQMRVA